MSGGAGGYRSYDYLGDTLDRGIALTPELGRVPAYDGGFSPAVLERSERLLADNVTISLHDHPVVFPAEMAETPRYNRTGRQHTAFAGLAASGLTAVFDNMMDGTACVTGNAPWQWQDVITDLGMRQADLAHQSAVVAAREVSDILRAHADGTVALVFGLEAATPIGNDLDKLDILYGLGIRQIGIAYSQSNALGGGLAESSDDGLTSLGRRAVRRMNQVGLAVDVSHSSDRTGLETCAVSDRPVLITHAGARALWDIPRLKSDAVLKAVADTGGVIGISAAPHTTISVDHPRHSILSVLDHFRYCVDLVGIDHVGFGPDTLYGDHVALHHTFGPLLQPPGEQAAPAPEHEQVPYVDGLENPTECFHNLAAHLVQDGLNDEDVVKVLGGNTLRALREIWT